MAYKLILKDDYDAKFAVDGREIKCYSPKQLREKYPDGSYSVAGEVCPGSKKPRQEELRLPWTTLNVSAPGSHGGLLFGKKGYACVGEDTYVTLLKSRLPLLIPLFIILCAVIVAAIFLLRPAAPDTGKTVLAPNVDALSPDERASAVKAAHYTVEGQVLLGGEPVSNARVSLRQGADVKDTMTGTEGTFRFEEVSPGEYNLITEAEGRIWTQLVTVSSGDLTVTVNLPAGESNAIVNVLGSETPAIVVGGLDQEAVLLSREGSTLTLSMDVQTVPDLTADEAVPDSDETKTAQQAIRASAPVQTLEYLDLSLLCVRSGESDQAIHETENVLEMVIPFSSVRRDHISVYRYHDGQVDTFTRMETRPVGDYQDGSFYVGNGFLVLYASRFSTYAIGYDELSASVSGSVTIGFKDEVIVHLGTGEVELYYSHDANSTHDVAIQLIITSGGNEYLLGQSGSLTPGHELTSMVLNEEQEVSLSVGAYTGMLRLVFFNGETELTNMTTDIPVTVFIGQ